MYVCFAKWPQLRLVNIHPHTELQRNFFLWWEHFCVWWELFNIHSLSKLSNMQCSISHCNHPAVRCTPRIYLITGWLHLLPSFTHFAYPHSHLRQPTICSPPLCTYLFVFKISQISGIKQPLSFSAWFISHSNMPSRSIHVVVNRFHSFL